MTKINPKLTNLGKASQGLGHPVRFINIMKPNNE